MVADIASRNVERAAAIAATGRLTAVAQKLAAAAASTEEADYFLAVTAIKGLAFSSDAGLRAVVEGGCPPRLVELGSHADATVSASAVEVWDAISSHISEYQQEIKQLLDA